MSNRAEEPKDIGCAGSRSTAGPINWTVFDQLRALQGEACPDILHRVISIYLSNSPKLLGALHAALETDDLGAMRMAAHSLNSSSAMLGALRLSELCREIEVMCLCNSLTHCTALVSDVEREFASVAGVLAVTVSRDAS